MRALEIYIIIILISLSYYFKEIGNEIKEPVFTLIFSILILVYVSFKLWNLKKTDPKWYLQPIAISSISTILLQYVFSNILYTNPDFLKIMESEVFVTNSDAFHWINFTLIITFGATVAMWFAYESRASERLSSKLSGLFKMLKFKKNFKYKPLVILVLLLASVLSVYLQLNLGIFGWKKSSDAYEFVSISGLLDLLQQLSLFAVLLISLNYYSGKTKKKLALILVTITAMIIGIMHVSKGAFIMPPLLVLFVSMFYKDKIRLTKVGMILVFMIFLAYLLIEPLRLAIKLDKAYNSKDINSLITNMEYSLKVGERSRIRETFFEKALTRQNMLIESAVAIRYKEVVGLGVNSPPFLNHLLLEPVYAFIPRLLWPTKPSMQEYTYWHQLVAHKTSFPVSRGMGPIGYLYMAGGTLLVIFFFGIIGLIQKIIYRLFYSRNAGKFLIYLVLVSNFIPIQTAVYALSYDLIRDFIFTYIFQLIFFEK